MTVDLNGSNAFFVDSGHFDRGFLENLKGLAFQDCFFQLNKFKLNWEKRFKLIEDMGYKEI